MTDDALVSTSTPDDGVVGVADGEREGAAGRARCERCGNHYDKAFTVSMDGISHTFDCFECAINALAPRCAQCNGMIIGHGVETDDRYFCCAHCAQAAGVSGLRDRVGGRA